MSDLGELESLPTAANSLKKQKVVQSINT